MVTFTRKIFYCIKWLTFVLLCFAFLKFSGKLVNIHYSNSVLFQFEMCNVRNVTRIIHQSWKNKDIPERFQNYSKSWTHHCCKNWRYILWTDNDNRELIRIHYRWFLEIYDNLPRPIYRADISRYFYLFHFGGVYTDLDNECLKPFEHLLEKYSLVFGAMQGQYEGTDLPEGYVQNSFMYSQPRQIFWLNLIQNITQMFYRNETKNISPEMLTGPIILSKMLKDFRVRNRNHMSFLKIYPPLYFNPFSWINKTTSSIYCKDYNWMTLDDWQKCKRSMMEKGAYVVQYHAHTWN